MQKLDTRLCNMSLLHLLVSAFVAVFVILTAATGEENSASNGNNQTMEHHHQSHRCSCQHGPMILNDVKVVIGSSDHRGHDAHHCPLCHKAYNHHHHHHHRQAEVNSTTTQSGNMTTASPSVQNTTTAIPTVNYVPVAGNSTHKWSAKKVHN